MGGKSWFRSCRAFLGLSWSFPSMSVIRGFFQGFNNMKPYAISQIAEQVIRVIWCCSRPSSLWRLALEIMCKLLRSQPFCLYRNGSKLVGSLYYLAKTGLLSSIFKKQEESEEIDTRALLIDTIREAIPFIITGSAIQLFQIVDQMTFYQCHVLGSQTIVKSSSWSCLVIFSANPNKNYHDLDSSSDFDWGVGIPLLTENYVKGDL